LYSSNKDLVKKISIGFIALGTVLLISIYANKDIQIEDIKTQDDLIEYLFSEQYDKDLAEYEDAEREAYKEYIKSLRSTVKP